MDYDPNVLVQIVKPKNKHKLDIQSAVAETATYPIKDTLMNKKLETVIRFRKRFTPKKNNLWWFAERNT